MWQPTTCTRLLKSHAPSWATPPLANTTSTGPTASLISLTTAVTAMNRGGGVLLKHVGTSSPSVADTKSISHPFNTRKKPKTTTNSSSLFFMIIHLRTICLHVPGSSPRCPLGHISGHAHLTFLLLTMYSTLLMFPFTTCPVCIRKLPEGSSYYYFDYSHNCFFCT